MLFRNKKGYPLIIAVFLLISLVLSITGCSGTEKGASQGEQEAKQAEKPTLVFADAGWDSIRFHNDVASFIIEHGYGYKSDVISGSTPITVQGLAQGDIDIYMEVWTDNVIDVYQPAIKEGNVVELSVNFDDDIQGIYVPTYIIKGDPERGIEPVAPDLKKLEDLPKYWELFKDPEDKTKGRIYGAIPGWAVDQIITDKINNYGLDKYYNVFRPGSDAALSTSMVQAVEKGEPWLGYYWEPTWIIGKYDMTLLQEEPYTQEKWENGYKCMFPSVKCTVAVNKEMLTIAPEVVEFLKKYKTSSSLTSEALAYMQDHEADTKETAKWFLQNNKDMWKSWLPADIAQKVENALNA